MAHDANTNDSDLLELEEFFGDAAQVSSIGIPLRPPIKPLAILEKLGPSPFERGGFPLIGFLATTYEKVSTLALERAGYQDPSAAASAATDIPSP